MIVAEGCFFYISFSGPIPIYLWPIEVTSILTCPDSLRDRIRQMYFQLDLFALINNKQIELFD
jgi:hypothetical protein